MAPPTRPLRERLLERREIDGECWLWTGPQTRDGYGVITVGRGRQYRVHRVAYETFVGPIPAGMLVCHRCDVPTCFRPEHLFTGTYSDNAIDRDRKGRGGQRLAWVTRREKSNAV